MEKLKANKFIVGGVIVAVLFIGVFLFTRMGKKTTTGEEGLGGTLPRLENYKKAESSIKASATLQKDGKHVQFSVANIPTKYKKIEYEFTYKTATGALQGGMSSPTKIKSGAYEKEILLGTCSAGGACTYDQGVTEIKFSMLFDTGSEKRLLEKTFSLE